MRFSLYGLITDTHAEGNESSVRIMDRGVHPPTDTSEFVWTEFGNSDLYL